MKTVMMQYQFQGEKWEIWNTEQTDLQLAWNEIDEDYKPTEGGWISFKDESENEMAVNGGFQEQGE